MPRAKAKCNRPVGHPGNHVSYASKPKTPTERAANTRAVAAYRRTEVGRNVAKSKGEQNHAYAIARNYGINPTIYWDTYNYQGGKCALCMRATGRTKRLAVDHSHHMSCGHDPKKGCLNCCRGLLCGPCNRMLGHMRDDPETLRRAIRYLEDPPMQHIIRKSLTS